MSNIIKVVLMGTANGYGETVLVKTSEHSWIVVDSCMNPLTKTPLPLKYLRDNSIELQDVKLVVCSHWHSDHIRGMDTLLSQCPNASFCFAITHDKEKFMRFVEYESRPEKSEFSSTEVFARCLEIARQRNTPIIQALQDRLLIRDANNTEVSSLSPSDETLRVFETEISTLFGESLTNVKIMEDSPNDRCIVLLIKAGNKCILLGADLEQKGWRVLLDTSTQIQGCKYQVIKIPHHGSENGYCEDLWRDFADKHVTGQMSCFNGCSPNLPRTEMISRYNSVTEHLYLTSAPDANTSIKRITHEKSLEKAIKEINPTIKALPFTFGIIESTCDLEDKASVWTTKLYGSAIDVTALKTANPFNKLQPCTPI